MTASIVIFCLLLAGVKAVVELDCSDHATCVEKMTRDLVSSLRSRRAVRLFDTVTIEPLGRQGRSSRGFWDFAQDHAVSFDWKDFTFRLTVPEDGRDDALDLEMYEAKSAKVTEVPDTNSKKSSSKVEEETEAEDKAPKLGLRRRQKKKVMQAVIPLLFGMKSAGVVLFAFTIVAALTIKAFIASKLALLVTIGMAVKKLYESYSTGVGLQNHSYLYSQYPIDFPSASSHAYSVTGVSPQFASQEMYNPTGMGSHAHSHEILQSQDASAQQSQQAPTLLVNSTNAAEQRWDGKSLLLRYLEPIIDGVKSVVNPIANMFYGGMPTFRGLSSDVSTAKSVEADTVEQIKKPKEFLIPQPRHIAQRKTFRKNTSRPKKHVELNIDLDKLKHNKDLHDYIKTKKYKYNYPNTYYYPRVKYVVNPNSFYVRPNNSRLVPYRQVSAQSTTTENTPTPLTESYWKPIIIYNETTTPVIETKKTPTQNNTRRLFKNYFQRKPILKRRKRIKRDLTGAEINVADYSKVTSSGRGMFDFLKFDFFDIDLLNIDPIKKIIYPATELTTTLITDTVKMEKKEPLYYGAIYDLLMTSLDIIDGIFSVEKEVHKHYFHVKPKPKRRKYKLKKVKLNADA